jgi:hypothetical protein
MKYPEVDVDPDTVSTCQLDILVEGSLKYSKKGYSRQFIVPVESFHIDYGLYKTVLNAYSYPGSKSAAGSAGSGQLMTTIPSQRSGITSTEKGITFIIPFFRGMEARP